MLADAFEALKKYDWGTDLAALGPIDDAAVAAHSDPHANQDLENRLTEALKGNLSRDAHDYVCRKLAIVGTAACVPTLTRRLGDKDHSHMARYALERINAPEAGQALRDALGTAQGNVKVGVISSLGARRDSAAVAPLGQLLKDSDATHARAAALALGAIGDAAAVSALQSALQAGAGNQQAVIDALFACAEALRETDKKADAVAIYTELSGDQHGRLVRLAATRGLLACGGQRA